MSDKLTKHKYTGSMGPRYGLKIRKIINALEASKRIARPCPSCGFLKVKRVASGIFFCRKCEHKFTGGAYNAYTLVGQTVARIIRSGVALPESKVGAVLEKAEKAEELEAESGASEKAEAAVEKAAEELVGEERAEEELEEEELPRQRSS